MMRLLCIHENSGLNKFRNSMYNLCRIFSDLSLPKHAISTLFMDSFIYSLPCLHLKSSTRRTYDEISPFIITFVYTGDFTSFVSLEMDLSFSSLLSSNSFKKVGGWVDLIRVAGCDMVKKVFWIVRFEVCNVQCFSVPIYFNEYFKSWTNILKSHLRVKPWIL